MIPPQEPQGNLQLRVYFWMMKVFGAKFFPIASDKRERNFRFVEEALELVQAAGMTRAEVDTLADYVYARPVGVLAQEVGGVELTLVALCTAHELDKNQCADIEMQRVYQPEIIEKIRRKYEKNPEGTPRGFDTNLKASLDERAWQLYCAETAGSMDVRDFWHELPDSLKELYRAKARDRTEEIPAFACGPSEKEAVRGKTYNETIIRHDDGRQYMSCTWDRQDGQTPVNIRIEVQCEEHMRPAMWGRFLEGLAIALGKVLQE